jgi:hypothetical protein
MTCPDSTVLPGVYRVRVDLMLDSRWPDFVNRMISTIPLGVLAGLASISLFSREIMPMPINSSQSPVPDRLSDRSCCIWPHSAVPLAFGRSSRIRPFLPYPTVPAHPAVLGRARLHPAHCTRSQSPYLTPNRKSPRAIRLPSYSLQSFCRHHPQHRASPIPRDSPVAARMDRGGGSRALRRIGSRLSTLEIRGAHAYQRNPPWEIIAFALI